MTAKLLVVDDEQILRIGTAWTLREFGYDVDEAVDGLSALEKIKKERYALILMDLNMPNMTGIECTTRIRSWEKQGASHANIVIALSSSVAPNARAHCLRAGMNEYIDKGCTKHQLGALVRQYLECPPLAARALSNLPKV